MTARELLDRGAERIDAELAGQPVVQARLLGTIGGVYGSLGVYDRSATLLERASRSAPRRPLGREHADTAASMEALAEALPRAGAASTTPRRCTARRSAIKRRVGRSPASTRLVAQRPRAHGERARPLRRRRAAAPRGDRAAGGASSRPTAELVAVGLNNLAPMLRQQGRLDDAAAAARARPSPSAGERVRQRRTRAGARARAPRPGAQRAGRSRQAPSRCCARRSRSAARRYGDDHPDTATAVQQPRLAAARRRRDTRAEALYRLALASTGNRLGPTRIPTTRSSSTTWRRCSTTGAGRPRPSRCSARSLAVRREALRRRAPGGGAGDAQPGTRPGRPGPASTEAEPLARDGAGVAAADAPGRALRDRDSAWPCSGRSARLQRRHEEAEQLLTEALEIERTSLGAVHPQVARFAADAVGAQPRTRHAGRGRADRAGGRRHPQRRSSPEAIGSARWPRSSWRRC